MCVFCYFFFNKGSFWQGRFWGSSNTLFSRDKTCPPRLPRRRRRITFAFVGSRGEARQRVEEVAFVVVVAAATSFFFEKRSAPTFTLGGGRPHRFVLDNCATRASGRGGGGKKSNDRERWREHSHVHLWSARGALNSNSNSGGGRRRRRRRMSNATSWTSWELYGNSAAIKNSSTTTGGRLNATASSTGDEISDYLPGFKDCPRNLKVAYQGEPGAYSEAAALTAYPDAQRSLARCSKKPTRRPSRINPIDRCYRLKIL